MAETIRTHLSLIFLSLLTLSSSLSTDSILHAGEILSSSGYLSMYLTLRLVSNSVILNTPSLTIFSPSDLAFARSGQPSLALLRYHFSPLLITSRTLRSLTSGMKIPTLSSNRSLLITSSPSGSEQSVYINGVKLDGKPVYDDGSLIIFGVDRFFDMEFDVSRSSTPSCSVQALGGIKYPFRDAIGFLRSNKYSVMAMFLDLQLIGFKEDTRLTIFAPADEVMTDYLGELSEYSLIFFRHAVPCKISWSELMYMDDGSVMETYLEGFGITITRAGDILMLNEVPITFPDMYQNDWLVIHGLRGMFEDSKTLRGDAVTGYKIDRGSRTDEGSISDGGY